MNTRMTEREIAAMGTEYGGNAATWVEVDSADDAARLLEKIADGDPEVMDLCPSPLSGEWAGESIPEMFGYWPSDDLLDVFESAFSEAFWSVLECRLAYLADDVTS